MQCHDIGDRNITSTPRLPYSTLKNSYSVVINRYSESIAPYIPATIYAITGFGA